MTAITQSENKLENKVSFSNDKFYKVCRMHTTFLRQFYNS